MRSVSAQRSYSYLHLLSCKVSLHRVSLCLTLCGSLLFSHSDYIVHLLERRYDVYLTKEPHAYEAMALVHSRVRRVVFGIQDQGMGGLGGAAAAGIHSLPGTNHHYRAFRLETNEAGDCDKDALTLVKSLQKLHGDSTS